LVRNLQAKHDYSRSSSLGYVQTWKLLETLCSESGSLHVAEESWILTVLPSQTLLAKRLEPADGSPLNPDQHGSGIVGHRSDAWRTLVSSSNFLNRDPEFEEMMDLLVKYPFNFLANFEDCQIEELAFSHNLSWWSDLQHHLVIMLSFVCLCWQRGIFTVEYEINEYQKLEAYRDHAYEETMKYCREVIKPVDEELAKKLAWKLITPLVRNHSQMRATDSCPTM